MKAANKNKSIFNLLIILFLLIILSLSIYKNIKIEKEVYALKNEILRQQNIIVEMEYKQ